MGELDIANFPVHYVKRLSTWEWEITNDNVTFVSCYDDDVRYSDRGFVKVTVDDILEQTSGVLRREDAEEYLRRGEPLPEPILLFRFLHNVLRRQTPSGSEEQGLTGAAQGTARPSEG